MPLKSKKRPTGTAAGRRSVNRTSAVPPSPRPTRPNRSYGAKPASQKAPETPANWTVMVYMAAELSPELDAHAVRDLREMEQATIDPGVRVVVQIARNWPADPQRYEIIDKKAQLAVPNVPDTNTGDPKALASFIRWTIDEDVARDRAETNRRYFLILWGHSYGLGFGRDHGDPLSLFELREALDTFKHVHPGGRPLDILGANACAMAYAEAAFELRHHVALLVASQIAVPFAGWPFETVLGAITPASSSQTIGQLVVEHYVSTFRAAGREQVVAMSLLNLTDLDAFKTTFGALADSIAAVARGVAPGASDRLAHLRATFLSAGVGEVRPLIDLRDLCRRLIALADDLDALQRQTEPVTDMRREATVLLEALEPEDAGALRNSIHSSRLVIASKQTGDPRGLNGLGIFAPFVTDPGDLKRLGLDRDSRPSASGRGLTDGDVELGRDAYKRLELVVGTPWEALVYDTLRAGLPTDVLDSFQASGAASLEDRSAVSQMLAAVDSLFDGLDRQVERARFVTLGDTKLPIGPLRGRVIPDAFLEFELVDHEAVRAAAAPPPQKSGAQSQRQPAKATPPTEHAEAVIQSFKSLEASLADLEQSVQRTLTNGTFGLGPGPGGAAWRLPSSYDKAGGGQGPPDKAGGGQGAPDKAGGGQGAPPDKAGGGQGAPTTSDVAQLALAAMTASPSAAVAELFGAVGRALLAVEKAVREVETLVAQEFVSGGVPAKNGAPSKIQIKRGFRILAESSTQARRVLRRVLAHPIYGFGRGADDITAEDRRELARAGGLSTLQLQLM